MVSPMFCFVFHFSDKADFTGESYISSILERFSEEADYDGPLLVILDPLSPHRLKTFEIWV